VCRLCSRARVLHSGQRATFARRRFRVGATHIAQDKSWLSVPIRQTLCRSAASAAYVHVNSSSTRSPLSATAREGGK
jgi:hypothetical protein